MSLTLNGEWRWNSEKFLIFKIDQILNFTQAIPINKLLKSAMLSALNFS